MPKYTSTRVTKIIEAILSRWSSTAINYTLVTHCVSSTMMIFLWSLRRMTSTTRRVDLNLFTQNLVISIHSGANLFLTMARVFGTQCILSSLCSCSPCSFYWFMSSVWGHAAWISHSAVAAVERRKIKMLRRSPRRKRIPCSRRRFNHSSLLMKM